MTTTNLDKDIIVYLKNITANADAKERFTNYCKSYNLNPLKRQAYLVNYKKSEWNILTGIEGYRTIATRTGLYAGGKVIEMTMKENNEPDACSFEVKKIVQDQLACFVGTVYFDECKQVEKDGSLNYIWKQRPKGQFAKVAEAATLRMAFPDELGDAYTDDEISVPTINVEVPKVAPVLPPKEEVATKESPKPISDPQPNYEATVDDSSAPEIIIDGDSVEVKVVKPLTAKQNLIKLLQEKGVSPFLDAFVKYPPSRDYINPIPADIGEYSEEEKKHVLSGLVDLIIVSIKEMQVYTASLVLDFITNPPAKEITVEIPVTTDIIPIYPFPGSYDKVEGKLISLILVEIFPTLDNGDGKGISPYKIMKEVLKLSTKKLGEAWIAYSSNRSLRMQVEDLGFPVITKEDEEEFKLNPKIYLSKHPEIAMCWIEAVKNFKETGMPKVS